MGLINYKDNTIGRVLKENESFFKGAHNKQNYFLDFLETNLNPPDPGDTYLTFSSNKKFKIVPKFTTSGLLQYSFDHETWADILSGEKTPLNTTIYFRGLFGLNTLNGGLRAANWEILDSKEDPFTGSVDILGNINTLLNYQNPNVTLNTYAFKSLFYNWPTITTPPELPNTTVGPGCYASMFTNSGLMTPPELPATVLADSCYLEMFSGCKNLITTPELPATTLAPNCYRMMFSYCSNLTTPASLPAIVLSNNCYENMFDSCSSLTVAPELPATTLADNCYVGMLSYCTSLEEGPELPATTLAPNCYINLFAGCTSLITPPELPATTLAPGCYKGMFSSCTSLIGAPALPVMTMWNECYFSMFAGCTSLATPPELPATSLAPSCYKGMFANSGLIEAPDLPATQLVESCYSVMFEASKLKIYRESSSEHPNVWQLPKTGSFVEDDGLYDSGIDTALDFTQGDVSNIGLELGNTGLSVTLYY